MGKDLKERDVFIIPHNFIEKGKILGGAIRLRNALEAVVLVVISIRLIFLLPYGLFTRIIIICCISLPIGIFAVIGIDGESLSEFLIRFLRFFFHRRILSSQEETAFQKKWWTKKGLFYLCKRLKAKLPHRKISVDEKDFEIVYYESEEEIPENAQTWHFEETKPLSDQSVSKKNSRKKKKKTKKQEKYISSEQNTTSDFVPIASIENGIIETKDGRFVRIIEVEPINFLLRSPIEQRGILYSFSSLLKVSPVQIQFKVISRKANISKHMEKMKACIEHEENVVCKEMGNEYLTLVKQIGSKEAVTRRFFICVQYEDGGVKSKSTYSEIVTFLDTAVRTLKSYLLQSGNETVEHEDEDAFLAEIFYTLYHRKTSNDVTMEEHFTRVFTEMITKEDQREFSDVHLSELLAPSEIDLSHIRYIQMDGLYHSYLMIGAAQYKTKVLAGWLSFLVNAGEGIDMDLFLHRQPKYQVVRKIGQQRRINRSKIKETSDTNTDFDDLGEAIASGYYLKNGLAGSQDFFYASIFITVTAETVSDLEWRIGELKKMLLGEDMDAKVCTFEQEAALNTVLPLVHVDSRLYQKSKRNMLTSAAASCYPFTSFEMSDDNGVLMGVNTHNNSMVIVDLFNTKLHRSPNIAILGSTGAGKTFTMQLLALRMRMKGIQCYILVPAKGHEFRRSCENIGGTFGQIAAGSPQNINFFEIRPTDTSNNERLDGVSTLSKLAQKIQKIHVGLSLMIPDASYEEKQLLDEALVTMYAQKGITHDNSSLEDPNAPGKYKEMPLWEDLYTILLAKESTQRMANILSVFVTGSASSFNAPTNIDLENLFMVLDVSSLSGTLLSFGMYMTLDFFWDQAMADRTKEKMIFIPELWKLMGSSSNDQVANFVLELFKTIRGYGGGAVADTQDIVDLISLANGKYGLGILNACPTKIILGMEIDEATRVQENLRLSDAELMNITHFSRGTGLISTGNNTITVEFKCSKKEHSLITTDLRELRMVLEEESAV